jgi:hypothetical protein
MSLEWMERHVTHLLSSKLLIGMDESCRIYEWVISHTNMSHVALVNAVASRICSVTCYRQMWISYVTQMIESCLSYEWVVSLIRMEEWNILLSCALSTDMIGSVVHMNGSSDMYTYECITWYPRGKQRWKSRMWIQSCPWHVWIRVK